MVIIRYKEIDMLLQIYADALYLSASRANIQAGGHHYLSDSS